MAEWIALLTSDHEVSGSNPSGDGILLMTVWHFIAKSLSLSHFRHLYMTIIMF